LQRHEEPTTSASGNGPIVGGGAPADRGVAAARQDVGRRLGIGTAAVVLVLLIAFLVVHHVRSTREQSLQDATADADAQTLAVDVVRARAAPTTDVLTLPGETRAWYESTIYARVSGYAASWKVDIGDSVKKGQVLATIDTPDLDAQLRAAEAKLKASVADVAVAEANVGYAKSNYDRIWFSPKGVVSQQDREQAKAEYDSGIAKVNAAQAQVNIDQAEVDRLTTLESFKQVTAPFDGTITSRRIDIGDLVTAGSTSNTTSLFNIAQDDPMRVFVDVPQDASAAISVGQAAQVTSGRFAGRVFTGKVARTARAIDPVSRTLRVEVDIANPDTALISGMYVQVLFHLQQRATVQVPASALIYRSSGPQVAVISGVGVDGQGQVNFRSVEIAHDEGDVVQIDSGLSPDDLVALNISNQINDGQKVRAVEGDEPATQPAAVAGAAAPPTIAPGLPPQSAAAAAGATGQ